MQLQSLKAATREAGAKGKARQERRDGNVPGVLYGGDGGPVTLTINAREFVKLIQAAGSHALVQIDVSNDAAASGPALLKDVQYHPVRGNAIHADFQRIRLDERITTLVPLHFVGHCKGLVDGGVLDYQIRELEIECLALEVPGSIDVDITDLGIGDHLYVESIVVPEGVSIVTDSDRSAVACHAPRAVKEETPGAAEGAEGAAAAAPADAKATADAKAKPGAAAAKPEAKKDDKGGKK
ncbi:MAG: 50S ribosomal protein L25 [Candidatus Hydrogenedentes bacterium]|nr:50S ribosomal protein L25 [Candidatus Hydrogenedentota bacterium]